MGREFLASADDPSQDAAGRRQARSFDPVVFANFLRGTIELPDREVRRIHEILLRRFYRRAHAMNRPRFIAEEAAEEALALLRQRIGTLRDDRALDSWALRIFWNRLQDLLRHYGPFTDPLTPAIRAAGLDPEQALLLKEALKEAQQEERRRRQERALNLEAMLLRFTQRQRDVYRLYYDLNLSHEEVGAMLGITGGRVRHIWSDDITPILNELFPLGPPPRRSPEDDEDDEDK